MRCAPSVRTNGATEAPSVWLSLIHISFVQLVDARGEMTKETKWAGVFCKDADKEVLADLRQRGLLFKMCIRDRLYNRVQTAPAPAEHPKKHLPPGAMRLYASEHFPFNLLLQ